MKLQFLTHRGTPLLVDLACAKTIRWQQSRLHLWEVAMDVRDLGDGLYIQVQKAEYALGEGPEEDLQGALDHLKTDKILDAIGLFARQLADKLNPGGWPHPPSSIDVTVGLSLTHQGSILIVSGEAGATFECTLHWDIEKKI